MKNSERLTILQLTNWDPLEDYSQHHVIKCMPFQEKYNLLQSSCIKAAEEILLKKPRNTFKRISQTQKVKAARKAYISSTKEDKNMAKQKLTDAY